MSVGCFAPFKVTQHERRPVAGAGSVGAAAVGATPHARVLNTAPPAAERAHVSVRGELHSDVVQTDALAYKNDDARVAP
jgi:hypothetical protein